MASDFEIGITIYSISFWVLDFKDGTKYKPKEELIRFLTLDSSINICQGCLIIKIGFEDRSVVIFKRSECEYSPKTFAVKEYSLTAAKFVLALMN